MESKKVVLIRHGETSWSSSGKHTGLTDIPLIETGKKEALSLAPLLKKNHFNFEKAFVSPLQRAKETFDLMELDVPMSLDKDLYEWNYGSYEGLTSEEIHKTDPSWSIFTKGAPGGESLVDIEQRVHRVLAKIEACQGNVILFSSGHFLRALATLWLKLPLSFGDNFSLNTGSISILGHLQETPSIILWNGRMSFFS